jgi:hypothetical protein
VAALDSELAQQRARSAGDSLAAEIEAIRFASQKRADAAREAGNFDAAAKEAELGELAIADARRKAEEQSANELDRVNGEIARRRLDRLGNSLDAELLQIEQSYKERIAAAQAAGKLELASRLEALKQEEMAAARAKGVDKGSAAEVVLRYTAFTGKTGTRAGRSVEETELPKQTAALQSIDTRLAKGVPAVAA